MTTTKILNILTAIVCIGVCYLLIFEDTQNNKLFWGALALLFLLQAVRMRRKRMNNSNT